MGLFLFHSCSYSVDFTCCLSSQFIFPCPHCHYFILCHHHPHHHHHTSRTLLTCLRVSFLLVISSYCCHWDICISHICSLHFVLPPGLAHLLTISIITCSLSLSHSLSLPPFSSSLSPVYLIAEISAWHFYLVLSVTAKSHRISDWTHVFPRTGPKIPPE